MKARSIAMGILLTYVSSASQPLVQDRVDYDMDVSVKTFSFKGSHNSYDQGHFIPEQVDGFNVWSVELDLCGVSWDYYVEVKHGCTDTPRGYLFQYLAELLDSHGWRDRVTFIWMDIKEDCVWPFRCDWRDLSDDERADLIADELLSVLGQDQLYTWLDWWLDGQSWPSVAELVARGKHFVPIYDNNAHNPNHETLFVTATESRYIYWHTGFLNSKDGDFIFGSRRPTDPDQFLWRAYDLENEWEWNIASANGIHLLATDRYMNWWTFSSAAFPPAPIYVDRVDLGSGWGTYLNPLHEAHLDYGATVAAENTSMKIAPGNYGTGFPLTIDKPMTLEKESSGLGDPVGDVFLGRPDPQPAPP